MRFSAIIRLYPLRRGFWGRSGGVLRCVSGTSGQGGGIKVGISTQNKHKVVTK